MAKFPFLYCKRTAFMERALEFLIGSPKTITLNYRESGRHCQEDGMESCTKTADSMQKRLSKTGNVIEMHKNGGAKTAALVQSVGKRNKQDRKTREFRFFQNKIKNFALQ